MRRNFQQKGFVLLFALLVATVLLTLGIGIANIIRKEFQFASIGKNSIVSYYAADTGAECALANNSSFGDTALGSSPSISCSGLYGYTFSTETVGSTDYKVHSFVLGDQGDTFKKCSSVQVRVEPISGTKYVISRGFNVCNASETRNRVERALYVRM